MHMGYIKIWRKVEDSGLYQLPNAFTLFVYLLTKATHKPIRFGTVDLVRGQICTGRHKLAGDLGMTEQAIRTALEHLHRLDMITSKPTNKFTVYSIVNYNNYQDQQPTNNQQDNQQATNDQPTSNQPTTTIQTHKHISTKEKPLCVQSEIVEVLDYLNAKASRNYKPVEANAKFIIARLNDGATVEDMKLVIDSKVKEWAGDAKWSKYLRPATLFNAEKYAQYSGETSKNSAGGNYDKDEFMKRIGAIP